MALLALAYLFLVSGLLGFTMSRVFPESAEKCHISAWFFGAALSPTLISVVELTMFKVLNGYLASKFLYLIAPIIIATFIAGLAYKLTREIPVIPPKTVDSRKIVLIGLSLLLTFGSLLGLLTHNVTSLQIDYDLSVYLIDASSISKHFSTDFSSWPGSAIKQPHSLAYSVYLAWGFLFESNAGFGSDMTPKMLIAFNHVSALIAIGALVLRIGNWYWAIICSAAILLNPIWGYQFNAFSRDSYYITPVIILFALLLASSPGRSRAQVIFALLAGLAAVGGILGHSLGILGAAAVFIGVAVTRLIKERWGIFKIAAFWISGVSVALGGGFGLIALLSEGASKESGFAFPFYTDPFVLHAFNSRMSWGEPPDAIDLIETIASYNKLPIAVLIIGLILVFTVAIRAYKNKTITSAETTCFSALVSTLILLTVVIHSPLDLDGLTLSNAFASNLRYGFLIGLLTSISFVLALQILVSTQRGKIATRVTFSIFLVTPLITLTGIRSYWPSTANESRIAISHLDNCSYFKEKRFRLVYADSNSFIYFCPTITKYLFTEEGAKLLGKQDKKGIADELENQGVDAVTFNLNIKQWWSGAALYQYLSETWVKLPTYYGTVFVKPGR